MAQFFPLTPANSQQVLPIPGGAVGTHDIYLNFTVAPSAGLVTIESRFLGSSAWVVIPQAAAVPITSGALRVRVDGAVSALRVTFAELTGGSGPVVWLSSNATASPPSELLTDGGFGPNARLRVDVAQTGFFAGREFRTFHRWATATTATQVIKAVVPVNIILFELGVTLVEGEVLVETLVGGTEGGTFATPLSIFPTNTMTERPQPPYVNQVLLTTGGTLTGGTLLDPLIAKAADNSNFAASVGASAGSERGVAANTYYFRMTLTGARGNFKARWEERP